MSAAAYLLDTGERVCSDCVEETAEVERELDADDLADARWEDSDRMGGKPSEPTCARCQKRL